MLCAVHLQPRAAKPGVSPVAIDAKGDAVLKARVSAAPTDGQANAELCAMLAKAMGVPKSAVRIERGDTSRHKRVAIGGLTLADAEAWARGLAG